MKAYDMIMEGLSEALQYEKGEIEARKERVRIIVQPVPAIPAAKIKCVRAKLGLSQKGLAEFMGVSIKTVEAWEGNRFSPQGPARRLFEILEQKPEIASSFVKRHTSLRKTPRRVRSELVKINS